FVSFYLFYGQLRDLLSFPTRRSSDLALSKSPRHPPRSGICRAEREGADRLTRARRSLHRSLRRFLRDTPRRGRSLHPQAYPPQRSEEHTSELQSRENLVCRLLLEKKK